MTEQTKQDTPLFTDFTTLGMKFNDMQQNIFDKYGTQEMSEELLNTVVTELNTSLAEWTADPLLKEFMVDKKVEFSAFIEDNVLKLKGTPDLDKLIEYVATKIATEQQNLADKLNPEKHRIEKVQPKPGESATGTLLDGLYNGMIAIGRVRYGDGYIAFIANEDVAGYVQSQLTSGDDDYAEVSNGLLSAVWFPCSHGASPLEAALVLEEKCLDILRMVDGDREGYKYILGSVIANWYKDGDLNKELAGSKFVQRDWAAYINGGVAELAEKINQLTQPERDSIVMIFRNNETKAFVRDPISCRYLTGDLDAPERVAKAFMNTLSSVMPDSGFVKEGMEVHYTNLVKRAIAGNTAELIIDGILIEAHQTSKKAEDFINSLVFNEK